MLQNLCVPEKYTSTENNRKLPKSRNRIKPNSRILPETAIEVMTDWYDKHYSNPYPSYREFEILAKQGQITITQVKQWFVNVRRRYRNKNKTSDSNDMSSQKKTSQEYRVSMVAPMASNQEQYYNNCQPIYKIERYISDSTSNHYNSDFEKHYSNDISCSSNDDSTASSTYNNSTYLYNDYYGSNQSSLSSNPTYISPQWYQENAQYYSNIQHFNTQYNQASTPYSNLYYNY